MPADMEKKLIDFRHGLSKAGWTQSGSASCGDTAFGVRYEHWYRGGRRGLIVTDYGDGKTKRIYWYKIDREVR